MEKLILTISLIFALGHLYAQSDSVFVSVSPTNNNILYIGIENPISIGVTNLCGQQPVVKISCGSIKYCGNGQYSVLIDTTCGWRTGIQICYTLNGTDYSIERVFRNHHTPNPVIKMAGKLSGSTIQKNMLLLTEIKAQIENFDFYVKFKVISYSISTNAAPNLIPSDNEKLSPEQRKLIFKSNLGDAIYFKNIKVMTTDKIIRELQDCVYYIK